MSILAAAHAFANTRDAQDQLFYVYGLTPDGIYQRTLSQLRGYGWPESLAKRRAKSDSKSETECILIAQGEGRDALSKNGGHSLELLSSMPMNYRLAIELVSFLSESIPSGGEKHQFMLVRATHVGPGGKLK